MFSFVSITSKNVKLVADGSSFHYVRIKIKEYITKRPRVILQLVSYSFKDNWIIQKLVYMINTL